MKRDKQIAKHVMDLVQAYADHNGVTDQMLGQRYMASTPDGFAEESFRYHLGLLLEDGYLRKQGGGIGEESLRYNMTWKGHDLLDAGMNSV